MISDIAKAYVLPLDDTFDERIGQLLDVHLHLVADEPRRDVLDGILNIMRRIGLKSVIVEKEYVEADYLETFAFHYSKAFQLKPSTCCRIHFFACPIDEDELPILSQEHKDAYLGYCTLRPTGHQYISRTVVKPPHLPEDETRFLHAAGHFRAHLFGQELHVDGAPFIQQDANTFICAGAAIWCVALYMHAEHEGPRFFPAEIAQLARSSFSHGHLRQGLTTDQIVMTLQRLGFEPCVMPYWDLQKLRREDPNEHRILMHQIRDLIHVFVDSGIPPILAYGEPPGDGDAVADGHAVAVVGHDIVKRTGVLDQDWDAFRGTFRNSYFVDTFYVMDDDRGPYAPFHFDKSNATDGPCLTNCEYIAVIAPMPCEVAIDYHYKPGRASILDEFTQMKDYWNDWIEYLATLPEAKHLQNAGVRWDDYLLSSSPDDPIVARPALLDSRRWKKQVIASSIPSCIREVYQALLLPKYIWVAEIAAFSDINKPIRCDRRILGETIFDATANPHSPLDSLIAVHVKGLLMVRSSEGEIMFHLADGDFQAYAPLRRSI